MDGIEIGVRVTVNIYLHVDGNDMETPFDHERIVNVYGENDGTGSLVEYTELGDGVMSGVYQSYYHVSETREDIVKAIEKAREYKTICLNAVSTGI